MIVRPKYVYKYKSLVNDQEFERAMDVIVNRRIYIPSAQQLNDPMESMNAPIHLGVVGSGYAYSCGMTHSTVKSEQEKYRIFSISTEIDSSNMWAYYGAEYKGYCLIFETRNTLKKIEPVIYTDCIFHLEEEDVSSLKDLGKAVRESYLYKKRNWSYENEWRLIQKKKPGFQKLVDNDLQGVVIGNKMSIEYQKSLEKVCIDANVPILKTRIMRPQSQLIFVPLSIDDEEWISFTEIQEMVEHGDFSQDTKILFGRLNNKFII